MEQLTGEVFRMLASENYRSRSAGLPEGFSRPRIPWARRETLFRLTVYSLIAAQREMLGISKKLAESLDTTRIRDIEEYVYDLSSSRNRCRRTGIGFEAFLPMLRTPVNG